MKLDYNIWLTNGHHINTSDELIAEVREALGNEAADFVKLLARKDTETREILRQDMEDWEKEVCALSNALTGYHDDLEAFKNKILSTKRLDRSMITNWINSFLTDIKNYI